MPKPSAVSQNDAVRPQTPPARRAICIEQRGGGANTRFHVLEVTLQGDRVTSEREVDAQYWRDLAEQAATRWLRRTR